ncbi:MAG: cell division topological specificity factor MinE [Synergistetes bacterium]|nr:cell division topological specificity factor MinE [Synergistota bacterium]MCX8127153.1 cell division topological specificity factor MinE [Synergistota bacterium]MDW8191961.1 cell division topological specificity factor MinE [Synergistota bacterium]
MFSLFKGLFKRGEQSSQIAKSRLEIMVKHDRAELTRNEMIEMMDKILMVLRDYVSYDRDRVEMKVKREKGETFLFISVPVIGRSPSRSLER